MIKGFQMKKMTRRDQRRRWDSLILRAAIVWSPFPKPTTKTNIIGKIHPSLTIYPFSPNLHQFVQ